MQARVDGLYQYSKARAGWMPTCQMTAAAVSVAVPYNRKATVVPTIASAGHDYRDDTGECQLYRPVPTGKNAHIPGRYLRGLGIIAARR